VIPCLASACFFTGPNQLFLPPTFGRHCPDFDKLWIFDLKPAMVVYPQFFPPNRPDHGEICLKKSMNNCPGSSCGLLHKDRVPSTTAYGITCMYYGINKVQNWPFYSLCSVSHKWSQLFYRVARVVGVLENNPTYFPEVLTMHYATNVSFRTPKIEVVPFPARSHIFHNMLSISDDRK